MDLPIIKKRKPTNETVPSFSAFCRFCRTRALACLLPSPGLALSTAFSVRSLSLCRTRWALFFFRRSRNKSVFSFSVLPFNTPLVGSVQPLRLNYFKEKTIWQAIKKKKRPWTSCGANKLASLTVTGAISSMTIEGMLLTILISGSA